MESSERQRFDVRLKITASVLLQIIYAVFCFHCLPIPVPLWAPAVTRYCVPLPSSSQTPFDSKSCTPDQCNMRRRDNCEEKGDCTDENKSDMKCTVVSEYNTDTGSANSMRGPQQIPFDIRLVYTLRWLLFSSSTIMYAIADVALRRYSTKAIDPIQGHSENLVEVKVRILHNTVEQFICHAVGLLVLCTLLSPKSMKIIPILVSLFVIGRIAFKIGYEKSPFSRTYGFSTTYVPTFVNYLYCIACIFNSGFTSI